MDDYIQKSIETGGVILWKNSRENGKGHQRGQIRKACTSLFVLELIQVEGKRKSNSGLRTCSLCNHFILDAQKKENVSLMHNKKDSTFSIQTKWNVVNSLEFETGAGQHLQLHGCQRGRFNTWRTKRKFI